MNLTYWLIMVLLGISLLVSLVVIARARSYRSQVAGKAFLVLMIAIACWLTSAIIENISPGLSAKILWIKMGYFGITVLPVAWLIFTLSYADKGKWVTVRNLALLLIVPMATLIVVWTNDYHHLMWVSIWLNTNYAPALDAATHGIWFWIHAVYSYTLIFWGLVILLNLLAKTSGIYRKQVGLMCLAALAPWISNLMYIFNISLSSSIDITPMAFTITGGVFFWGFTRMKLLRTMPVVYETIFRKMNDIVIIIDSNNRVTDLNLSAQSMLNLKLTDSIGKSLEQTLPEHLSLSILNAGQDEILPAISLVQNNVKRHYEISISPINEGKQTKSRIILLHDNTEKVIADIDSREKAILEAELTERKKSEKALADSEWRLRTLREQSPVMICFIDLKGSIQYVNRKFEEVTQYRRNELIGNAVLESGLFLEESRIFLNQLLGNKLAGGKSQQAEVQIKRKDAELIWVSLIAEIIKENNAAIGLQVIAQDISESKLAKERLENANRQLMELDRMKDNLLSTVSHELRTPLSSIKSFAEILLTYEEDRTTQVEFLKIIDSESDRLTRLINDFLDLSKIQAGSMQWKKEEIALTNIVNLALKNVGPLIQNARLELFTQIDESLPKVIGDGDRLVQVITNLLGNAIKFTPEGGKLTFMAWSKPMSKREDSRWVTVNVTDTGIGIAPENHQKIFENFGQVGDVLKDRPKGTGLGLPICKKIIENFGGKIWVESALGKGTSFYFTLPAVSENVNSTTERVAASGVMTAT